MSTLHKHDHHLTPEERLTEPVLTGKTSDDLDKIVLFDEITDYLYVRGIETRIGLSDDHSERTLFVSLAQLAEVKNHIATISEAIRERLEAELQGN